MGTPVQDIVQETKPEITNEKPTETTLVQETVQETIPEIISETSTETLQETLDVEAVDQTAPVIKEIKKEPELKPALKKPKPEKPKEKKAPPQKSAPPPSVPKEEIKEQKAKYANDMQMVLVYTSRKHTMRQ